LVDAAKLYEYTVIAETQCENETVFSNEVSSIGFRTPFGTVTGNVTYTGGTAVKDVKITAETTSQIVGHSLEFNGDGKLEMEYDQTLEAEEALAVEMWFKPNTHAEDFSLIRHPSVYELRYDNASNEYQFEFYHNSGTSKTISIDAASIAIDNFHHIAAQVYEDSVKLVVDGQVAVKELVVIGTTVDKNSDIVSVGEDFKGLLTELRVWASGRSEEVLLRDANRHLVGGETGLRVYLKTNEGVGEYAYDGSKINNIFNRNHARFIGNVTWVDDIPTISQLGYSAFTEENGIYILNIPYNGIGENFVLTPTFGTHEFDPATKALFIGDGATVQNNVDFLDKSSFRVTGFVFYDSTTCAVPGAFIRIDGEIAVLDGAPIQTADDGSFDVQVPIGFHHLSLEKAGHTFSVGRFPETGKYDFQEDLANLQFKDNTKVKLVGRVVGGLREGTKIPGLGKSINNIGQAEIILTSQQGNGCFADTVLTNNQTGEYIVEVPPLKYIPEVNITSNPTIDFGVLDLIDMSNTPILKTEYDSTFSQIDSSLVSVDSIKYHEEKNYIHRVRPKIAVTGPDGRNDFIGDTTYTYINAITQDTIVRNLRTDPFRWPVFTLQDDDYLYRCMIKVYEEYINLEDPNSPKIDSVPTTDGKLVFKNEISHIPDLELELEKVNTPDTLKALVYSFKTGVPNFAENNSIPDYSYTRRFELYLQTSTNEVIQWEPVQGSDVPMGGDNLYRAYLLGTQSNGEQFVTEGPEYPEYILRDPPGSNSFATREVGTTKTEVKSWSWNLGSAVNTSDKIFLGAKFNVGVGVSTATDIKTDNIAGLSAELGGGNRGSQKSVTTNTKSWSTNSSTDQPGRGSDLYVGKSQNVQFGVSEELAIVPDSLCNQIECIGQSFEGYSFAKKYGLSIVPEGYSTTFFYDEAYIINYLIPDLIDLRNAYLQSNPTKYTNVLPIDDPNYGKSNNDPVFNNNLEGFDLLSGPSYTYNAENLQDSLTGDKVYTYNLQIDKWHEAIRLNEWEKVNITNQEVIDSLREKELDELLEDNAVMLAAYAASGVVTGGAVYTTYGLIVTPVPGTALIGYATFGVTTAAGIANAELQSAFDEYLMKRERIIDKFDQISVANYTISGGNSFTSSMTHQSATSHSTEVEFGLSASFVVSTQGKISNTGVGLEKGVKFDFKSKRDWSEENSETETVSFTFNEPDQGDAFSVDVYPSMLGFGPIFKKRAGGQTSCPHEPAEYTQFYEPGLIISEGTQQRDKPEITVSPSIITNVPIEDPAVFNLTLTNASESGDPRTYQVGLVSTSNPFGALVSIDGSVGGNTISIPPNTSINKTLVVRKGPGPVYNYDSLLVVIYAPCQYQAGTSDNIDIVDSVYVSAHFLPTCTDVSLAEPEEQWVLNNFNNDTLQAAIIDYNINFFDFEKLRFEYKPSNEADWIGLQTFYKDTTGLNTPDLELIPTNTPFTLYDWDVSQVVDGNYDIRVVTECLLAEKESIVYSGIMDRINPHPFGNPSPADGIVSPNDEISIKFNEPIDQGSLTALNFDIRGVTNGTEKDHSTSLYFDGLDDYMEITGGAPLRNRDFTISFAAKRNGMGEEAILTQGTDEKESIFIGFNAEDKFVFRIGSEEVASANSYTDDNWRYYAVSYNFENETAELYVIGQGENDLVNSGNTSIHGDYKGNGKVVVGKNSVDNMDFFDGNIHEIAIWSTPLSLSEFSVVSGIILSGSELGLLFNWRMDEAEGILAKENVRRRDATIYGATWTVEPSGRAVMFDGDADMLKIKSSDVAITPGMDFTLEFWFNSTQSSAATLFSNGTADITQADSILSWNIDKDAAGRIIVKNYGIEFVAVEDNYFDGEWHHFALVLQRTGNLSAYIDGNLQNSTQATPFKQLGGSHVYLGARGYQQPGNEVIENYYLGAMDEFRFWNASRKVEQIRRDKRNRMMADELGLQLYMPFENYELDATGIPILTPTFEEQIDTSHHVTFQDTLTLTGQTPTIKLQRPVQGIAFTYSVNNDEIIFTPTTSQEIIENVTLDVTVQGVKDLQGNVMESPKTWIAYMDKNQVVWQDDLLSFEKEAGAELSFSSAILNQGGAAKSYEIKNIPEWLTVTPNTGVIPPNSSKDIDFEVDPLMNIGDYVQDIQLLTDFNFPEKLTIDLKVREKAPDWAVDPADFQNSMGIIGALEINEVISTDREDMLAAFVGDEVRGVNNLQYIEELDRYLVFLDIYSNETFGEEITFKVWDASEGIIYTEVEPEFIIFNANSLEGTTADPQLFVTSSKIVVDIDVKEGWNWVSNFLLNPDSTNLDITLESIEAETGDEIKGQTVFSNYSNGNGWRGTLNEVGIRPESLYKLNVAKDGVLSWRGDIIDPSTRTINLNQNWNWIGFISIRNQSVEQAFGNLNAQDGDLVKGRSQFAVFDSNLGWIGSLETLVPGFGYMYQSAIEQSFTYPVAGMFRNPPESPEELLLDHWPIDYGAYASNMTAIADWDNDCDLLLSEDEFAIGIFDPNGNCRGASMIDVRQENKLHYLTIGGTGLETLHAELLDLSTGESYPMQEIIEYASNSHLGSIQEPLQLSFSDEACKNLQLEINPPSDLFNVYPSIFDQHLTIEYVAEIEDEDAVIAIYNIWGQIVFESAIRLKRGFNRIPVVIDNQAITAGTYFSVLRTNGKTEHQKLIKQ
jgi:hypothetical protein